MNERIARVVASGRVGVITGAAKGIGAAIAKDLAARGMRLSLLDTDRDALTALAGSLDVETIITIGDVASPEVVEDLYSSTFELFGDTALLVNNAGIPRGAGPWDHPDLWQRQLDVNFNSIVRMQHLFVPRMIASDLPGAVVNLGSKEGITTPPGNAAYSVAKAGVKVLTEQLAHELMKATSGRVSAHLLVPGYTWTPMNFPGMRADQDTKPAAPITAEELTAMFMNRLHNDEFYIICPDNEVTADLDARRIQWAADDMIKGRPALSRWHPEHKEEFAAYIADLKS